MPNDTQTFETLENLKQGIKDTINYHTDDNLYEYKAWENVSRLRKSHIIHSKGYGVTIGVFIIDSEHDLGQALTVNFDSTITEHYE